MNKRPPDLKAATWLPRAKIIRGTRAFLTGSHSLHEQPAIADLRAEAIAAHLRPLLPPSRTVTTKPHVCSAACREAGDLVHTARHVEIEISTRAEKLALGPMRHWAKSKRRAERDYSKLASEEPEAVRADSSLDTPDQPSSMGYAQAALELQASPVRALWCELEPYRERFMYDPVSSILDHIEEFDPAKVRQLLDQLQAMIDDPKTPHALAGLHGHTLTFVPQLAELEGAQEDVLADLLSEMNQRDGGTCVFLNGQHGPDEPATLADRRSVRLLDYFRSRASVNVLFEVRPHVCGSPCAQRALPILRRIAHVVIQWQPRNVMLENIRVAALGVKWFPRR